MDAAVRGLRSEGRSRRRHARLRTQVAVLAAVALLLPLLATGLGDAATARPPVVRVSVSHAPAGSKVRVRGMRFPGRTVGSVSIGGTKMLTVRTGRGGRFAHALVIPAGMAEGATTIVAQVSTIRASVRFTVDSVGTPPVGGGGGPVITKPVTPGACPLEGVVGLPPRNGIVNGVHTRPDDPLAPDACRAGLDSAHPESSLKPITNTAFMALLKPGVKLSGYNVTGCIEVQQDNVTIENTVITCKAMDRFDGSAMIVTPSWFHPVGLTFRHLDLRCLGPGDVDHACSAMITNSGVGHGLFENVVATGVSGGIGGGGTGGDATGPFVVRQNWFHNFVDYVSADGKRATHDDGVYLQGTGAKGTNNILIRHNVIDMTAVGQTVTAEIADADSGLIDQNWLWGAGYTIYVNPATGYTATHTNNWLKKGQWGIWHFATGYNPPGKSVCTNNWNYDTQLKLPDRCV